MGFAHLVNINAVVEAFKARYNIPRDVHIECLQADILGTYNRPPQFHF